MANWTMHELEADSEPVFDDRALIALSSSDRAEFEAALIDQVDGDRDSAHDAALAEKILKWEAAGVSPEEIVDLLVNELVAGEEW